jgi:hypothetical protein
MQWLCQVSQGPDLRALTVGGGCFRAPVQGAMPVFEAEKSKDRSLRQLLQEIVGTRRSCRRLRSFDLLGAVKNSAMKQQKQQHQIHQ